jgi:2'-5' RNA ligase
MPETIRSFIAFDIDNPKVLQQLCEAQNILAKTNADLSLVKPQNIHITLRFLGDITLSMVEKIDKEMQSVVFRPFDVEIKGVGAFPNVNYARVVWAGIQQGADELKAVFDQLEPKLRQLGFASDSKGFSPHLTIARVGSGRNKQALISGVNELAAFEFGKVHADCLQLKKSVLTPQGPIYSTLKEARASV